MKDLPVKVLKKKYGILTSFDLYKQLQDKNDNIQYVLLNGLSVVIFPGHVLLHLRLMQQTPGLLSTFLTNMFLFPFFPGIP